MEPTRWKLLPGPINNIPGNFNNRHMRCRLQGAERPIERLGICEMQTAAAYFEDEMATI